MLRTSGLRLQRALSGISGRLASTTTSHYQHNTPATTTTTTTTAGTDLPTATAEPPQGDKQIRTHHARPRLPARAPLLRNFFAGTVDTDLLSYPEPIARDDMQVLERNVQQTAAYFADQSTTANAEGVLDDLRRLGAFGLDVPAAWGGGNCTVTEVTRHAEMEANADLNVAAVLNAHRRAVRCLVECGTAEQQERYLPRMASGELTGAVAIYETDAPPASNGNGAIFRTRATHDDSGPTGSTWLLHGEKACVTNAPGADLFVVFAQTTLRDHCGDPIEGVSAFLVDRRSHGVHVQSRDRTLGCEGVAQATLRLDGCAAEPLGSLDDGMVVAQRMLRCARLQAAVVALTLQKRLLANWTRYAVQGMSRAGAEQQELLRARLSREQCAAYALESMVYLTTGILDGYTDADVDVETAALRVFAVDGLRRAGTAGLEFAGAQTTVLGEGGLGERELRDALQVCAQGETNDTLRMYVAMSGAKHVGESLHEVVSKVRNPLYNPSFMFRRMFESSNIEEPKCTLQLNHYLHPSLDPAAQWLEQSVLRLQAATEIVLTRHGMQVFDRQCELNRLSQAAVQCFATFAAIARASRAYCIGLQHADHELLTASTFAFDAQQQVRSLALELRDGPYLSNDLNHQKLAAQVMRTGGYFTVHPLMRNH